MIPRLRGLLAAASLCALASSASAQLAFNEIYASHAGTDDQEFIELVLPANFSLDGILVLVVEGDSTSAGTLDRAWDLSGLTVPADGFFLLGNTGVTGIDFDLGADNAIENGTNTFYLVSATDPSAIAALVGTDVDPEDDGTTILPGLVATVFDLVAMVDGGVAGGTDVVYDGAQQVGPDGSFLPAGIFRGGDEPGAWCDRFLDFDDDANFNLPRTPGAPNIACPLGSSYCFGDACPCGNDDSGVGCASSLGSGALLLANGSLSTAADDLVMTVQNVPAGEFGLVYMGSAQIDVPFGDGKRCAGGNTYRYPVRQADALGAYSEGPGIVFFSRFFNLNGQIAAGQTWNFQGWYRDPGAACGAGQFNLTNAVTVTFVP